jgi:hypothetical protein
MNGNVYCRKFQWITKNTLQAHSYIGDHQLKRKMPLHLVEKCHSWKIYISRLITKKVHKSPKTLKEDWGQPLWESPLLYLLLEILTIFNEVFI